MRTAGHAAERTAAASGRRPRLGGLGPRVLGPLAFVVLLGLGLRVWSAVNPIENPGPDADAYARIARALYEDGTYGTARESSSSDWSPGAPLLFAATYKLVGSADPVYPRLLIALIGGAMIVCVFVIGLRLAGAVAGLIAALIVATYPTYIENNGQLLTEPLAAFLLAAALLCALWAEERDRRVLWVLPGVLLGALILTRPEYQAITLLLALVIGVRIWRGRGLRAGIASGLIVVVAAGLVVAPWMIRNRIVLDKWVPVSTGGGKALFVATYLPGGGRQVPTKRVLMKEYLGAKEPISEAELKGQSMTPLLNRVARKYPELPRDEALGRIGKENLRKYATGEPLAYAEMTVTKLRNMWERGSSPAMASTGMIAYHLLLLALAIAGSVVMALRRDGRFAAALLATPILGISVLGALLLAVPRRQVPLIPLVALFAAFAIVAAVGRLRDRSA